MTAELKTRPIVDVWGLQNAKGAPWRRPLNDAELVAKGEDPAEYETQGEGRWAW